jgi:hypothetical protein
MSIVRRVFYYLLTLIALIVFANGLGQLLSLLFDITLRDSSIQVGRQAFNSSQFSLGLAMVIIAGPLWFFFWRTIRKRVAGNPEEIGSAIRKFYLNLVLLVSAFTGLGGLSGFLRWLFNGVQMASFPSGGLAMFIVSSIIWFYHWRVSESEGHPSPAAKTLRRWYVYILSAAGLIWLAENIVQVISAAILVLPFWGNTVARSNFWNYSTQSGISWIILGAIVWYFHWFRGAKNDIESVLRQVYYYVLAITGGIITALTALATTLYLFLKWAFGAVDVPLGQHFQFLSWTIPTLLVGLAIWGYHRELAQEEQSSVVERKQSAQRIHRYLMSFISLGTTVAGLIILFAILLGLVIESGGIPAAAGPGGWRNALSLCLALLIVGTPLWIYFWGKTLKLAEAGGIVEWRATSRRIYLYAIVAIAIGTLIADLVNIVYQLINGLLQQEMGLQVLRDISWSLESLIVAVPLLWYHWRIIRSEQRRGAEGVPVHKRVTLISNDRTGQLTSKIVEKLGYKIRVLYLSAQGEPAVAFSDEEIDQAITVLRDAPASNVLIVVTGNKITVLPYQEK